MLFIYKAHLWLHSFCYPLFTPVKSIFGMMQEGLTFKCILEDLLQYCCCCYLMADLGFIPLTASVVLPEQFWAVLSCL
jgi:hypothetical protein